MKEYQDVIGKIVIAVAIVIGALLISRALNAGFLQLHDVIFMK